jgi:predicted DsbA family dithiol-disulfide isomerase
MDTQVVIPNKPRAHLEFDLIADFICPWSYLGKRKLERALESLYGLPSPALRWHGLRIQGELPPLAPTAPWREHLATRLPDGVSVDLAQDTISQAGRELGIQFDFARIGSVPDTREAHRLVKVAEREGAHTVMVDELFRAFFERGENLADHDALRSLAEARGLEAATLAAFEDRASGGSEVDAEQKRLRGLGVMATPNLLINGRILVPGPAEVATYVQALDQALFPGLTATEDKRLLH